MPRRLKSWTPSRHHRPRIVAPLWTTQWILPLSCSGCRFFIMSGSAPASSEGTLCGNQGNRCAKDTRVCRKRRPNLCDFDCNQPSVNATCRFPEELIVVCRGEFSQSFTKLREVCTRTNTILPLGSRLAGIRFDFRYFFQWVYFMILKDSAESWVAGVCC